MICEKLREIRARARSQRAVDTGQGWICGKGQFPHEWSCLDVPEKIQGKEVLLRVKKQLWHAGDRTKDEVLLSKKGISGDQGTAHPFCGEGHFDSWRRDGRGAWSCVVQESCARSGARLPPTAAQTASPLKIGENMRNCARMERGLDGFVERSHGRSQSPRIGEIGCSTVCVSSSALVECGTSPGGTAAVKGWSCVKASQRVCTNSARFGERVSLVDPMFSRNHRVEWRSRHGDG